MVPAVVAALMLTGCGQVSVGPPAAESSRGASPAEAGTEAGAEAGTEAGAGAGSLAQAGTNIVFVLADDLSMDLLQYMPNVRKLAEDGTSFSNYVVTDSLCCPSRSSILTGKFPHNTGVFTNTAPDGGFGVFKDRGNERSTFATSLQKAGYRTAMLGKYMNGYQPAGGYVPPGWNEWAVAGNAYGQYDYKLNENGTARDYGDTPADYLTGVLSRKASAFVEAQAAAGRPFLIEVAPFSPHAPYTPAPQDEDAFPGLTAPRGATYDTLPENPPPWLEGRTRLGDGEIKKIDEAYRKRAQAVQSVDRMVGALRQTLTDAGVADRTVVVFSSDNGYHLGDYRLTAGKQTAFETDVHVPLIVAGPGVRRGATVDRTAENIDLRPTFEQIAGVPASADTDGRSLVPLLRNGTTDDWRNLALIEHHRPAADPDDPDAQTPAAGIPPSYAALRAPNYTFVLYEGGAMEFYDRVADPAQLHNRIKTMSEDQRRKLKASLAALVACAGTEACWAAGKA